jgi:hypothetical protein
VTCRGGALIATLVVVLSASAAEAATTVLFKGAVAADGNSKLTFEIVRNKSGKRRVDYPQASRLDALCESGAEEIEVSFGSGVRAAKLKGDGTFEFDNSGEDYIAYVRGAVTRGSARGSLRYQGTADFPDSNSQRCDTGEVKWTAERR